MKWHGIMGFGVFTIGNKNLPDVTQAEIMFTDEVMLLKLRLVTFICVMSFPSNKIVMLGNVPLTF